MRIVKVTESQGGGAGDEVKSFTIWGEGTGLERAGGNLKPSRQSLLTAKEATRHHTWNGAGPAPCEEWLWKDTESDLDTGYVKDTEDRAQLLPPNYQSPAEVFPLPQGLGHGKPETPGAPTRVTEQKQRAEVTCGW